MNSPINKADPEDVGGDLVDHENVDANAGDEAQDGGEVHPGQKQAHRAHLQAVALPKQCKRLRINLRELLNQDFNCGIMGMIRGKIRTKLSMSSKFYVCARNGSCTASTAVQRTAYKQNFHYEGSAWFDESLHLSPLFCL